MASEEDVTHMIKRVQHRHHRAFTTALADLGISLVQWDTLRHLHRHKGASLHDLAQLTFQTDQAFGTLAARMVERGLIQRVSGPGRAVRHTITAKGEAIRAVGERRVRDTTRHSLSRLSGDELGQLAELLATILGTPLHQEAAQDRKVGDEVHVSGDDPLLGPLR
ncbi:MarR family winged helix-turn-helix transcriptional regulator [Deinococcus marmoris]|uniref:Transcriptional regulator, MarR family n=1 Tax=Deinococcus marmoris TaxID=249408 RepID=A0A1U7P129_9DEIO|nr:MarR family transcriptional regulator [Deinococcus marmoris]OLV18877.1 Transcriptional regulator, MarR family [Deinococcus marmoris]